MKEIFYFLTNVGRLKGKERKWWTIQGIKNSETTAEHIFHLALLVWILGGEKKHFDLARAIKMALLHDLCEVHSKSLSPYYPILSNDPKKAKKFLNKWAKLSPQMKIKKEKEKRLIELAGLKKLTSGLPQEMKTELINLWSEYEGRSTSESKFVRQSNKIITFLQAIEYAKKNKKMRSEFWTRWIKEAIDDPLLLSFLEEIESQGLSKKRR